MNIVHLKGNLTRDIELRYKSAGMAVAKTAIATSRKYTHNGQKKEEVTFIDLVFFGRSAEVANQYLNKGSSILLTGRITFSQWVDNSGVKKSKHEVIVDTMEMINTRTKPPTALDNQDMPQNSVQNTTNVPPIYEDEEAPF